MGNTLYLKIFQLMKIALEYSNQELLAFKNYFHKSNNILEISYNY